MFVSFVFLSNLTVADCMINENVMLLFIKNEHFKLLNIVCFWGTSSPDPLTRGFAPGPHWGLSPQTPFQPRAPALGIQNALFTEHFLPFSSLLTTIYSLICAPTFLKFQPPPPHF